MRILRRPVRLPLLRDSRGVSVIEFGLLAPILAFVIMGIIDVAQAYSRKMAIEQAVDRALEKAAVGVVQTDYTFLKTEVKNALPDLATTGITVTTWMQCDTTTKSNFQDACGFRANGSAEETSRYVKITVVDRWEPNFSYGIAGYHIFTTGSDGKIQIKVETSLRVQ